MRTKNEGSNNTINYKLETLGNPIECQWRINEKKTSDIQAFSLTLWKNVEPLTEKEVEKLDQEFMKMWLY